MSATPSHPVEKPNMLALPIIEKTREYLDYVERHILNIQKAWMEIQEKCEIPPTFDTYRFTQLHLEVMNHDLSKLSPQEFVQYRQFFYPITDKEKEDSGFDEAWQHHKDNNPHHWENWTVGAIQDLKAEMHCTHMIIDWLAMSYEFGDTPREFYEANKEKIKLPDWAVEYIYDIFEQLEA